ncbi:MAG: phage portal protein [Clostridium sp.]|nr:phage portal protein [Clostridium sp.]
MNIITNLDYEKSKNEINGIENFILDSIRKYKMSKLYKDVLVAKRYFNGESDIKDRKKQFVNEYGKLVTDNYKANNRVSTDIFKKIVLQENSTLLSNGVNIETRIKKKFARAFDVKLQRLGVEASLGGVGYGYVFPTREGFSMQVISADEFVPIVDVYTGELVAGIRFIQLDIDLPMKVEFYEIDGITEYVINGSEIKVLKDKTSYLTKKISTAISSKIETSNYSILPIIPLYNGLSRRSRLNPSLKSKIDLLEIILSDFGNNLEDMQDIYWLIKNYDGQDLGTFLTELKKYKTLRVQEDGDVKSQTVEVPYQAREIAIKILKKQIFSDSMALDTEEMSGTLTTVEINARRENLNLKVDDFENEVYEFMYKVMTIFEEVEGEQGEYEISFIRSGLINQNEIIDNIVKIRADIDQRTALELNPMINNELIDEIIKRTKEENELILLEADQQQFNNEENKQNKEEEDING